MKNVLFTVLLTVLTTVFLSAQIMPTSAVMPNPPVAKKIPKKMEIHGDVRVDDYYWMNERENPEVIAYLNAENAYREAMMIRICSKMGQTSALSRSF